MTDREKLEKVLEFAKEMEDKFYKPIEEGKHEIGSMAAMQCIFQASSFQRVRYFVEDLLDDEQ